MIEKNVISPSVAEYIHQTPHGGVKSLWMFSRNGEPSTEEEATNVEIHELDAEGNCLFRTYGYMNGHGPS